MATFLDTGFFLAITHPEDDNHARVLAILDELDTGNFGLLYTSELVVAEAVSLAWVRTKGNMTCVSDLEDVVWGEDQLAKILFVDEHVMQETRIEFDRINGHVALKKDFLSFTDVSSIVLCRTFGIDQIISFDSHFDGFLSRIR